MPDTCAADVICAICGVLSVIWIIVCAVPGGWHVSVFFYVWRFDTSLYHVTVSKEVLGHMASFIIPKQFEAFHTLFDAMTQGTYGLQEMADRFCGVGGDLCSQFSNLHVASWLMMIFGLLTVVFLWLALGFTAYFWHTKPTQAGLQCIQVFLICAPFSACIGVFQYFLLTVGLDDSSDGLNFGATFMLAVFAAVVSIVPITLWKMCVSTSAQQFLFAGGDKRENLQLNAQGRGMEMGQYGQQNFAQGTMPRPSQPHPPYPPSPQYPQYPQQPQQNYGPSSTPFRC